jgi:hypothetical protein
VQTFPGDAAVALRPTENPAGPPDSVHGNPQTKPQLNFRNTGKPRIRESEPRRSLAVDHCTPEKIPKGVRFGKTCCAATASAELLEIYRFSSFPGAGEGI